jgi:hypothetical protein
MFRCAFAAIAAVALALGARRASADVLAVLSDGSAGYQAVVEELRAGLRDGDQRLDTVTAPRLSDVDAAHLSRYELIVTVGLAAAQAVAPREDASAAAPPTLCLLIPRQSFEKLAASRGAAAQRRLSALFIDQPLSRQFELLRLALPEKHRVGIVLGPASRELEGELRGQAHGKELEPAFATVGERSGLYAALQALIPQSDVLLLLPDPVAINADTVYGLLLTSYRAQVPVVGFSEGLLNAGALLSLYSSAQQQGRQAAEMVRRLLAHEGGLPPPQYPRYFTVRVNGSVARSLGLHLPGEQELQTALGARESQGAEPRDGSGAAHGDLP